MPSLHRIHARPLVRRTLVAALATLAACGGAGTTGPGSGSADAPTLAPASSVVTLNQVTTITVRGARLAADTYRGSVGDAEVVAGRVNDSTVALVVPGSAVPGDRALRLRIGGADATATLRVAAAPPLPDAAAYLLDVDAGFRGRVDAALDAALALTVSGASATDPTILERDRRRALAALDTARALFDALSPDEQREAASIVRATYGATVVAQARRARFADAQGPDLDPAVCRYWDYPRTVEETEYCEELTQKKVGFWQTDTEQCAADAQRAAQRGIRPRIRNFLWQVVNGCHYAGLAAWTAETWAAIEFPTLPEFDPLQPFEGSDASALAAARLSDESGTGGEELAAAAPHLAAATSPLRFAPGTPTSLTPRVRFRAMTASDVGTVPAATEKARVLDALVASWRKFNAALGTGLTQAPATLADVRTGTARQLAYPASRLRLGTITPATVRGSATVAHGIWTVAFDADDRATDTPFTFDVIYDGGRYGSDTMTVSAVLGGVPDRYAGTFQGAGIANSSGADGAFACQSYYQIANATATAEYGPAASVDGARTVTFTIAGTYTRDPMHGSAENPGCPAETRSFREVVTGTATGPGRAFDLEERRLLDWPTTRWRGRIAPGDGGYRLGVDIRLSGFGGVVYETMLDLAPTAGP